MSYSFIGGYFLNSYLARFEEAVNLAAVQFENGNGPRDQHDEQSQQHRLQSQQQQPPPPPPTGTGPSKKPYTLVRARNVGYTAIVLLARDPSRLRDIQEAEVGFGAAEMGNKGAVGLRMLYEDGGKRDTDGDRARTTELTFVATHLAAMEWNLPRRNANWAAIMRSMTFENPEEVVERHRNNNPRAAATSSESNNNNNNQDDENEQSHLLLHDEHHSLLRRRLHDISVFKPSSHLFVAGDLNYRISTTSPPPDAAFPSVDPDSDNYYPGFFRLDQLTREKDAGRTLHGLTEHEVRFPPTYKYDVLPESEAEEAVVPWKFASHRYPSWTDRILYLDVPAWVDEGRSRMSVRAYDALPVIRTSDHRPVFLRVDVPLVAPSDLAPPPAYLESDGGTTNLDPRVRLPVEIDPEAWERRAAARRKEVMAGWSMFLWSTRQGAWILATMVAVGVGAYWLYQGLLYTGN